MSAGSRASDLTDVCRLCLDKERLLFPVFESDGLPSKIASCLQVEIQRTDELTQKICDDCANKVDAFYEFRNKTACSQKELEKWLMETKKEERQNQVLQLRELKATINQPKKVEEHGASPDEEDKEQEEEGNEELDEENDEDFDEEYETEECMNGDEEIRDDEQWNEEAKGKDELDFGPEPTNFVNVPSLDSEEPGPSGFQPPETDSLAVPEAQENTSNSVNPQAKDKKSNPKRKSGRKPIGPDLISHMLNADLQKYICDICPYSCTLKGNFKKHMMRHNKEYRAKCRECSRGFYSIGSYKEHLSDNGICRQNFVHKCPLCNRKYHNADRLHEHTKTHLPGYIPSGYQCETCGKSYLTRRGLDKHIEAIHKGIRHKCEICGKEVTCAQSLKNHLKIHRGEKSYVCVVCGKAFVSVNSLVVHERTHTGERPYRCEVCNKCFTQPSTLKVHRRYHTGERPYPCQLCSKSFVTRTSLKLHEKTHGYNIVSREKYKDYSAQSKTGQSAGFAPNS